MGAAVCEGQHPESAHADGQRHEKVVDQLTLWSISMARPPQSRDGIRDEPLKRLTVLLELSWVQGPKEVPQARYKLHPEEKKGVLNGS